MSSSEMRLPDDQLDALADRIAERLQPRQPSGLVDAAELARQLKLSRQWVYEHAGQLGAVRSSKRGRLRFDVAAARAALDTSPPANESRPAPRPRRRRQQTVGSILKVRT